MSAALHQDLCSSHIPPGRSRAPADGALSERSAELSAVVLGSQGVLLQTSRLLSGLRGKHTQSKQKLWRKWKWSLAAASGIAIRVGQTSDRSVLEECARPAWPDPARGGGLPTLGKVRGVRRDREYCRASVVKSFVVCSSFR